MAPGSGRVRIGRDRGRPRDGGADDVRDRGGRRLGIGIISRADEGQSRGLTTAAAIWVVAGLGVLCGVGLYVAAVTCTALVMLVLELDRLPGLRRRHTWLIRRDGNGQTPTPR
jgi:hypothetical protein